VAGNQLIPFINYPFLELGPLRKYIAKAHERGARVKLYYTVRRPLLRRRDTSSHVHANTQPRARWSLHASS
jgi:hypothetical protein